MNSKTVNPKPKTLCVFAPGDVVQIVEDIAKEEDRTTSHVVKRLLEESPRVKARRRRNGAPKARDSQETS